MADPTRSLRAKRFHLEALPGSCHPASVLESLLKSPGRVLYETSRSRFTHTALSLMVIAAVCLAIYGVVVGTLSGGSQLWIAPAKILLGSTMSACICLPSLYIFLCMSGADVHLRGVAGELLASVALTALLLVGFAPVAWVFSQSTDSIGLMTILHAAFWGAGLAFGLALIGRSVPGARPGADVGLWRIIYIAVCLQMMTTLRPIIGTSEHFLPGEKKFFLAHASEVLFDADRMPRPPERNGIR